MGFVIFEKQGVVFKNEDVRNVPLHGITKTSHVGIDDGFIPLDAKFTGYRFHDRSGPRWKRCEWQVYGLKGHESIAQALSHKR